MISKYHVFLLRLHNNTGNQIKDQMQIKIQIQFFSHCSHAAAPPAKSSLPNVRKISSMADVLDIDNAEEFEVDEDGDRKYTFTCIHLLYEVV